MGAISVLTLAGLHPKLPRAVVLEDPPAWWSQDAPAPYSPKWRAETQSWIAQRRLQTLEEVVAFAHAEEPGWAEEDLVPWAESKLRLHPNVFRQDSRIGIHWPSVCGKIACPALLLTADTTRDAIVTEAQAAALRGMVPHLSIAHISGAGHSIHRDQPARFLEVVRAFLQELPDEKE
jgi:pimeloyl-ACP methyl ester carboxylesterase